VTDVVLLTKEDCHFCEQAKDILARMRDEFDLRLREVALESNEGRDLALRSGAAFPPVVFVDGEPFSYGRLSERKLRKALRPMARSGR
jgi:glutaredoxin